MLCRWSQNLLGEKKAPMHLTAYYFSPATVAGDVPSYSFTNSTANRNTNKRCHVFFLALAWLGRTVKSVRQHICLTVLSLVSKTKRIMAVILVTTNSCKWQKAKAVHKFLLLLHSRCSDSTESESVENFRTTCVMCTYNKKAESKRHTCLRCIGGMLQWNIKEVMPSYKP